MARSIATLQTIAHRGAAWSTGTPTVLRDGARSHTVGIIDDVALLTASFDHSRVTELRHAVAACAGSAGLSGERLADFVVAVNELLTNAVRHGGGAGRIVLWRAAGWVVCEVADAGSGLAGPVLAGPHKPAPDEPGGWGLWLARELTDTLEIDTGERGTTVRVSSRTTV